MSDDSQRLKDFSVMGLRENELGEYFDTLRKSYPSRREYIHFVLPEWINKTEISDWFSIIKGESLS